jgi:hypothetical protein
MPDIYTALGQVNYYTNSNTTVQDTSTSSIDWAAGFSTYAELSNAVKEMKVKEKESLKFKKGDKVRMTGEVDGVCFDTEGTVMTIHRRFGKTPPRYEVRFMTIRTLPFIDIDGIVKEKTSEDEIWWTCPEDKLTPYVFEDGLDNWE